LEVLLSHWKPRTLLLGLALPLALLGGAGTGCVLLALPASAAALPESNTSCYGTLSHDSSGAAVGEPDLLDYQFNCTNEITAYTIVVDRVRSDGDNVDDYNPNPTVLTDTGTSTPATDATSTTESVNCGGETPSNGINCYSLVGATAGPISPGDYIEGSIDPTDQYCAYLPKGAKPGTLAVPRATVELVVTDNSGAEDGPFELSPTKPCAKVPTVVPGKSKPKSGHAVSAKS
jgi:hypothetical protein